MAKPRIEQHIEAATLKTTFVTRRLLQHGVFKLLEDVEKAVAKIGTSFEWDFEGSDTIDSEIFEALEKQGLDNKIYFCHPNLLVANPKSLFYFRSAALLSQKALQTISGVSAIKKIEEGKECDPDKAIKLARALNRSLSAMHRTLAHTSRERVALVSAAQAGITLDGSWRNQIGNEGERAIRSLILGKLLENGEIASLTNTKSENIDLSSITDEWIETYSMDIKSALCTNGAVLKFSSEPDVMCIGPKGKITAGIEVKAGLDPAGALERLGAMQKSFENILSQEPDAATVLLASCITDEVQKRLNASRSVTSVRDLTQVINNTSNEGLKFCNAVRGHLKLVESRF